MAIRFIKTAHLTSNDPTISVPDEVQERRDGKWIAVHMAMPDGDYLFDSLAKLEDWYGIKVPLDDCPPTQRNDGVFVPLYVAWSTPGSRSPKSRVVKTQAQADKLFEELNAKGAVYRISNDIDGEVAS